MTALVPEKFSSIDFMILAESYAWNRVQAERGDISDDTRRNHIDSANHRKEAMREITDKF